MPRILSFQLILTMVLAAGALSATPSAHAESTPRAKPNSNLACERQRVMNAESLAMYYYSDSLGLASVEKYADQITVLAPQCFTLEADGVVQGGVPPELAELARKKQLPIMPLLVNPGFNRAIASKMLRSPKLQERAASFLAYRAKRDNLVGWQLDLENIDPADRSHYSAFVRRVAGKLHRDGRLLSVAVPPRFSDRYPDTRDAEFRTGEWGAPFDFRALGRLVDFMVVMTYNHYGSRTRPGPVSGYDWIRVALDYATSRVPHHKLLVGIPFYGREWVETPYGIISRSMTFETLRPLLERPGIEIRWDERWRTPWIQYREDPDTHTIWFDDARSYREKLGLVSQYGLRGFAAWRLGTEDPEFWTVAAELAKESAKPASGQSGQGQTRAESARGSAPLQ